MRGPLLVATQAVAGALLVPTPAAAQATVSTVDGTANVGSARSVALGTDGLALISYYAEGIQELRVAHCQDAACTAASLATLDSEYQYDAANGIAIGGDGLGLIGYSTFDGASFHLKVAHCNDVACSSATISTLGPPVGVPYGSVAFTVGTDGRGIVATQDESSHLVVGHCTDFACTAANFTTHNVPSDHPSITIGGDGLPLIVTTHYSPIVVHCQDTPCSSVAYHTLPSPDGYGTLLRASVAAVPGGLGVIGVEREIGYPPPPFTFQVGVSRCVDMACSAVGDYLWFTDSMSDFSPGTGVLPGDIPILAYYHSTSGPWELRVAHCTSPGCFSGVVDVPDTGVQTSGAPGIAVSPQGGVLVAYQGSNHLKAAYYPPEPAPGVADLAVSVTASPDPANPGLQLNYTLQVTNNGPQAATGVEVSDQLSADLNSPFAEAGTCSLQGYAAICGFGTIPAGESRSAIVGGTPVASDVEAVMNHASVTQTGSDPNSANDAFTLTTALNPWLRLLDAAVAEGTGGSSEAVVTARLSRPSAVPVSVSYSTVPEASADPGVDFLTTSGSLSFAPGATSASFTVPIVTDSLVESDEFFAAVLSAPTGAGLGSLQSQITIFDDDAPSLSKTELTHGDTWTADLGPANAQAGVAYFRMALAAFSSYEIRVDDISPDVFPVELALLFPDGTAHPTGNFGAHSRASVVNYQPAPITNETIRITGACGAACDATDRYRIRFDETTLSAPGFNNAGGQHSIIVVSNPTPNFNYYYLVFFDSQGELIVSSGLRQLDAWGSDVVDTTGEEWHGLLVNQVGSVRILTAAPYGALKGKVVNLDPASGIRAEVPFVPRPR